MNENEWLELYKGLYLRSLDEREYYNNKANIPMTIISTGIAFTLPYFFNYIFKIKKTSLMGVKNIMIITYLLYLFMFIYCCVKLYKLVYNHTYYNFPKSVEVEDYRKSLAESGKDKMVEYLIKIFTEGCDHNNKINYNKANLSLQLSRKVCLTLVIGLIIFIMIGLIEGGVLK